METCKGKRDGDIKKRWRRVGDKQTCKGKKRWRHIEKKETETCRRQTSLFVGMLCKILQNVPMHEGIHPHQNLMYMYMYVSQTEL